MIDLDDLDDYDLDRLLSTAEAAQALGMNRHALSNRVTRGNGPRTYGPDRGRGAVLRFSPWELIRYRDTHVDGRRRRDSD